MLKKAFNLLLYLSVCVIEQLLEDKNCFLVLLYGVPITMRSVSQGFYVNTGKKMINAVLFCFTGLLQDSDNPYSRFENE